MRVLIWVQHLLGTGHFRRALALARAFTGDGHEVTIASGGPPTGWQIEPAIECVQLPWVRARDSAFAALVGDEDEVATPALFEARRRMLAELLDRRRPGAIVTEMFPFGRRAFRDEVTSLLEAAARIEPRPYILASVRDILVSKPEPARFAWMRDLCLQHYDRVLVHGDPQLVPFSASFPFAHEIAHLLTYTGYLRDREPPPPAERRRGVLVTAGGGIVGARVFDAAVGARPLSRHREHDWRILTGVNSGWTLPEDVDGITVDRHRDDVMGLMVSAAASVSQAGYNTVVEALSCGVPMLLVPFADAGEDEQTRRAVRLEEMGLAQVVMSDELNPQTLAEALDALVASPVSANVDLEGARASAAALRQLAMTADR